MSIAQKFLKSISRRDAIKGLGSSFVALGAAVGLKNLDDQQDERTASESQPVEARLHPAAVARKPRNGGEA